MGGTLLSAGGGCAALPALGGPKAPPFAEADSDPDAASGDIALAGAEEPADDSPYYEDDLAARRPGAAPEPSRWQKSRQWLNRLTGVKGEAEVSTSALPPEARAAFERARDDFDRGEHAKAEKQFKSLARRWSDTAIEEDALFYRAEALFASQSFAPAQDAYDTLLDRYPSTRHLDVISQRQFEIARRWLGYPEGVVGSDVKPVSYAEVAAGTPTPPPAERFATDAPPRSSDPTVTIPVLPNFHDSTRPLFDTTGRAMQGLKNVWLNDPTGELADDALFLSAGYHLRNGDYLEAGRLYDILRKEYPDSPHLKDAYLLGAHAREVVWQGAEYDDQGLKESRAIKEAFLRLFPDAAEREQVRESLDNMAEAEAEADWALLQLWERKGKAPAVATYARKLIVEHPGTRAAGRARRIWDTLPAEAKELAGPLPAEEVDYAEADLPNAEPSVRPPAARTADRPADRPAERLPERPTGGLDASPLPGSTQPPRPAPPARPAARDAADPFSGDPFSGMDPLG